MAVGDGEKYRSFNILHAKKDCVIYARVYGIMQDF